MNDRGSNELTSNENTSLEASILKFAHTNHPYHANSILRKLLNCQIEAKSWDLDES